MQLALAGVEASHLSIPSREEPPLQRFGPFLTARVFLTFNPFEGGTYRATPARA